MIECMKTNGFTGIKPNGLKSSNKFANYGKRLTSIKSFCVVKCININLYK